MVTENEITVEYNTNHSATATGTIAGGEYSCTCNGLATCGEPACEPSNPFDRWLLSDGSTTDREMDAISDDDSEQNQDWLEFEELRTAAIEKVKKEWNYNGSQWSEPVDDPDVDMVDDPDDEHKTAIKWTEFHGGGVVGYVADEQEADRWIAWKNQGTDCVCGCYEVVEADED